MPQPIAEYVEPEVSAETPSGPSSGIFTVSHRVWEVVATFLRAEYGVRPPDSFEGMLESRLAQMAIDHGFSSAYEFAMGAAHAGASLTLREALVDAMLPRDTGFYREPEFWSEFERAVAPSLSRTTGEITVWCAGAASGEEVWSLAMSLATSWPSLFRRVRIVGTDVSTHAVLRATNAVYPGATVRGAVSDDRVRACLDATDRDHYRVKETLRAKVSWRTHNLLDTRPAARDCHAIICRGVLRDMDDFTRQEVLDLLVGALRPDGWLGLGLDTALDGAEVTQGWARIA